MELSRRGFLQSTGAIGALGFLGASLSACTSEKSSETFEEANGHPLPGDQSDTAEKTVTFGFCRGCMKDDCGILVTSQNDVVTRVEGNPECATNAGTMCPRGNSSIMSLYNPHRVKAPMKRTNPEKGMDLDPGWIEITWDEAFDLVGSKMKAIREEDPRQLIYQTGFGMMDYFTTFGPLFGFAFGTTNWFQSNGPLCSVHYAAEMIQGAFPVTTADYKYGEYVISIGHASGANFGIANSTSRAFADRISEGMKIVTVDPRSCQDASMGEWVPILPGSDLAFVLGLLNCLMHEVQTYDMDSLLNRTNAPYLVDTAGDYVRGETGKPMMWDAKASEAREFDQSFDEIALEGAFEVGGVACKTGFTIVREGIAEYTPEWATAICDVPADTIRRLTQEFVDHAHIGETIEIDGTTFPFRPTAIVTSRGSVNHEAGFYIDLAVKMACELVGCLDVPGGVQGCVYGPVLAPSEDGIVAPIREAVGECEFSYPPAHLDLAEYFPYRHSMPYMGWRNVADPICDFDYKPKMALVFGGNPIAGCSDPDTIIEGFKSLEFVASVCYHMDEVALMSDVLLPEDSMLERTCLNTNGGDNLSLNAYNMGVQDTLWRQGVGRLYNTMQPHEIALELLDRCGATPVINGMLNGGCMLGEVSSAMLTDEHALNPGERYSIEDIWDRALKSMYGSDKGLGYLKEHGIIENRCSEAESYNYYHFPEGKTRYQFYLWDHLNNGRKVQQGIKKFDAPNLGMDDEFFTTHYNPVPTWIEPLVLKEDEEHPLFGFNFKTSTSMFRLNGTDQNTWMTDWSETYDPEYNSVIMNAETAKSFGLSEGDPVIVESPYGKTSGKLHATELVHPRSVGFGGATGRCAESLGKTAASRVHYNQLLSGDLGAFNAVDGGLEGTTRLKVYKA